jgi:hypothetical protein
MSQLPGDMRKPEDKQADLAWFALLIVASALGGLAAADITRESNFVAVAVSLLIAAILVFAHYQGFLDPRGPAREPPVGPPAGPTPDRPVDPGMHRIDPGATIPPSGQRPVPDEPVKPGAVQLVQQQSSGGGWWEGHVTAPSGGRAAPSPGPRKVDLSQFLDQALIAQCPNCGAFKIDVDNRAAEWIFGCRECRRRWTWQPGRPWPPIQVRPNARGQTDRPRA